MRGSEKRTKAGFGRAIRRLFGQAAKALTRLAPAPAPKKSGRRRGNTGRQFRRVANRITRWAMLSHACAAAGLWLADTLDWLALWHHPAGSELDGDQPASGPNNHLSPGL